MERAGCFGDGLALVVVTVGEEALQSDIGSSELDSGCRTGRMECQGESCGIGCRYESGDWILQKSKSFECLSLCEYN